MLNVIGKQSADIAQGVDRKKEKAQGAGDQGLMFGYATNETDVLMPAAITLSHRLVQRQALVRKKGTLPWLRPDAKSQVTLRYENDKPVAIEAVVLSTRPSAEGVEVLATSPSEADEAQSNLLVGAGWSR